MSDTDSISEFSMSQSTQITRYPNETETCNPNILRQLNDLPVQTMVNIFSNEKKYINEDEELEKKLYYVEETTKNSSEETKKSTENFTITPKSKNIFNTTVAIKSETEQLTKKKRGRQATEKTEESKKKQKIHDKSSTDNLLRKIQVHYMTFIISFVNEILENLNYNQKFLKIDYEFKKNVNKDFFESLKTKNLSFIVQNKVSEKYSKQNKNINYIIYDQLKENKILENIFKENYLDIFKNIYYKSIKSVNLSKYGLEKEIILKKVETYKDLLNEIKEEDHEYARNINICVSQNYLSGNKFFNY